jgi:hypothetical protein
MRRVYLFLRRIAGFFGLVFGGRRTRAALDELKRFDVSSYASRIVSDAVLMNDIPSPSSGEEMRMKFIRERLEEFGISNVFSDEKGNTIALFPAYGAKRDFFLLAAEVGDANYSPLGNAVRLSSSSASGQGLGERSLGAAALLVFAEFAQATGFHLDKNLLVLFTTSSSVDEREESFRHFLDGWKDRIACAVIVRGTGLGLVETRHVGSYRLSVTVQTGSHEILAPNASSSAASILGTIASQLGGLSWDEKRTAMVNIARMEAGTGYGHWASQGELDMEIFAEDEKMLETIKNVVSGTISNASAGNDARIETLVRFRRSVGDPRLNEPLTAALRTALGKLKIKSQPAFVSEKVSILNEQGIPAIALGITTGKALPDTEEIDLEPIASGFRQLLMVVEGYTDDRERDEL